VHTLEVGLVARPLHSSTVPLRPHDPSVYTGGMPRLPALCCRLGTALPFLLMLGLVGCGQTGPLFMRMPPVTLPELAPFEVGTPKVIFLPEGVTLAAPVSATHAVPSITTHMAPAAATHLAPGASTRR
jgi:hypothetical protein